MAHYIDADKLRAEIHKRKKSLRAGICGEAFTRKQKNEMLVASEELDRFNRIIDSLQQEQPEVDLEKEQDNYDTIFYKGMMYYRKQMMEEAVEGEIQMRYSGCLCAKTIRAINEDKFKLGDKVRIVVLKAEEE